MSHHVGEEGACGPEREAEHQDGYDALGVEQGDQHGGHAHQAHHGLGHLHHGLAGSVGLQHSFVNIIGENGPGAQKVGVGAGHGGGDDAREQQSADQRRHGVDGQHGQGVARANGGELIGAELAHVDQRQGDDAQDRGDEGVDKVHKSCQPCAALGRLLILSRVETGYRFLAHGEGCGVHDHKGNDSEQVVARKQAHGALGDIGGHIAPAAGVVDGEGNCDDHADHDQEHLDEVGQGDAPETAHDGVNGHNHGYNDHGHLVVDVQHRGQDNCGGDELSGGQAHQGKQHDDGGDQAAGFAVAPAEILGHGLYRCRTELGSDEAQDNERDAHGGNVPGSAEAKAGHAVLHHAQGAAAADFRGRQGACHQKRAKPAPSHHEVGVGGDLGGRIPADPQHDEQIDNYNSGYKNVSTHTNPSYMY